MQINGFEGSGSVWQLHMESFLFLDLLLDPL